MASDQDGVVPKARGQNGAVPINLGGITKVRINSRINEHENGQVPNAKIADHHHNVVPNKVIAILLQLTDKHWNAFLGQLFVLNTNKGPRESIYCLVSINAYQQTEFAECEHRVCSDLAGHQFAAENALFDAHMKVLGVELVVDTAGGSGTPKLAGCIRLSATAAPDRQFRIEGSIGRNCMRGWSAESAFNKSIRVDRKVYVKK